MTTPKNNSIKVVKQEVTTPTENQFSLVARGLQALKLHTYKPRLKIETLKAKRLNLTLPPAAKMSQAKIASWAKIAQNHNRAVILKNGMTIHPDGRTQVNQQKALEYEAQMQSQRPVSSQNSHANNEDSYLQNRYELGYQYEHGSDSIEQNYEAAFMCYLQAAEGGHKLAISKVAEFSWQSYSFPEGDNLAYDWYVKQAYAGHVWAQWFLGCACHYGRGIEEYYPEAIKWYTMAAKNNEPKSQWHLSLIYAEELGFSEDDEQLSFYWCHKAAEQGYGPAAYDCLIGYDAKVTEDEKNDFIISAKKWLEPDLATSSGVEKYHYSLILLGKNRHGDDVGIGSPHNLFRNHDKGMYWLVAAAEAGGAVPSYTLGNVLLENHSTELAISWFMRSANNAFKAGNLEGGHAVTKLKELGVDWKPQS